MGCGESRFLERAANLDDLNTVEVMYLGGPGYQEMSENENCPADKLVLAHTGGTDPADLYKLCPDTFRVLPESDR